MLLATVMVVALVAIFRVTSAVREHQTTEHAAPSTGRHVPAGDLQLFVQEAGPATGTPVLLVHGTGAWSEIWRETMTALATSGFRTIAIDVPPFGFSGKPSGASAYSPGKQADRIVAALDTLGIANVVVVGHSVGGRPAIETALRIPERISRLVLVDPALGFGPEGSGQFQQSDPSLPVKALFALQPIRNAVFAAVATNPLTTRALFKSFVSNTAAVTDARIDMLQQPLVVDGITSAEGDWFEYLMVSQDRSQVSDFRNFSRLTMPVLLIWGSTDTVTPLWQGRQLQKLIPHARLAVLNGVGHIPYIEAPHEFNETLVDYLR